MFKFKFNKTHFSKLSDKHVLALAIYAEEEDSKIYYYFANTFKKDFPETAKLFDEMGKEENEHRKLLIDLYKKKFGNSIPIVKREHVSGFYKRKPIWLIENLKLQLYATIKIFWLTDSSISNFSLIFIVISDCLAEQ